MYIKSRTIPALISLIVATILLVLAGPILLFWLIFGAAISFGDGLSMLFMLLNLVSIVAIYSLFLRGYFSGFKTQKGFLINVSIVVTLIILQVVMFYA